MHITAATVATSRAGHGSVALRLGREQFLGGSLAGLDCAVEVALGVDRGVLAGELDQGLPSQKSTVARPFHLAVIPGRSGSSWASNCLARDVGEPEPKPAPTEPRV